MAILPIVLYPDPVLLKPTAAVPEIDDSIRELVADMKETMYAAPGIGLAANQVGHSLRLCIVDLSVGEEEGTFHTFINPTVLSVEGNETQDEGCLSFPDVTVPVKRGTHLVAEATNLEGERMQYEVEGLMARCMLHEFEHLDGQTFLRGLSNLRRTLVKKQIRKRIQNGDWVSVIESEE